MAPVGRGPRWGTEEGRMVLPRARMLEGVEHVRGMETDVDRYAGQGARLTAPPAVGSVDILPPSPLIPGDPKGPVLPTREGRDRRDPSLDGVSRDWGISRRANTLAFGLRTARIQVGGQASSRR